MTPTVKTKRNDLSCPDAPPWLQQYTAVCDSYPVLGDGDTAIEAISDWLRLNCQHIRHAWAIA